MSTESGLPGSECGLLPCYWRAWGVCVAAQVAGGTLQFFALFLALGLTVSDYDDYHPTLTADGWPLVAVSLGVTSFVAAVLVSRSFVREQPEAFPAVCLSMVFGPAVCITSAVCAFMDEVDRVRTTSSHHILGVPASSLSSGGTASSRDAARAVYAHWKLQGLPCPLETVGWAAGLRQATNSSSVRIIARANGAGAAALGLGVAYCARHEYCGLAFGGEPDWGLAAALSAAVSAAFLLQVPRCLLVPSPRMAAGAAGLLALSSIDAAFPTVAGALLLPDIGSLMFAVRGATAGDAFLSETQGPAVVFWCLGLLSSGLVVFAAAVALCAALVAVGGMTYFALTEHFPRPWVRLVAFVPAVLCSLSISPLLLVGFTVPAVVAAVMLAFSQGSLLVAGNAAFLTRQWNGRVEAWASAARASLVAPVFRAVYLADRRGWSGEAPFEDGLLAVLGWEGQPEQPLHSRGPFRGAALAIPLLFLFAHGISSATRFVALFVILFSAAGCWLTVVCPTLDLSASFALLVPLLFVFGGLVSAPLLLLRNGVLGYFELLPGALKVGGFQELSVRTGAARESVDDVVLHSIPHAVVATLVSEFVVAPFLSPLNLHGLKVR